MSTTDKPTWLLAERFRDVPAIEEAITNFAHDQTGDNATGIVLAVLAHQAATEAANGIGLAAPNEPKPCRACDPSVGFICEEHGESETEAEADAYNYACELMEQGWKERAKRGVEIGTEGSLCDGIAWIFDRMKKLEAEAAKATGTAQTKQLLEKIEQLEAEVLARKLNPLNPFYDLEKDKDFRDNFERLASQGISKKQRGMILREVMRAIHAYAAESVRKAEAARHPAPVAAQESAPAELPPLPNPVGMVEWTPSIREIKIEPAYTAGQMREYGRQCAALSRPVVAQDQNARLRWALSELISTLPARRDWLNPDAETALREIFVSLAAAPASPQPVAKVLSDSEIKMVAYGHRIGSEVAVKFARAILAAASTPTTLTEPGNGSQS